MMEGGLDELIETLLTEIAFSGNRGCSVANLLQAISALENAYGSVPSSAIHQHAASPPRIGSTNDSSCQTNQHATRDSEASGFASKVWNWLAARNDIFIGEDAEFNKFSLSDILKLPEEKSGAVAEVEEYANDNPEGLSPPPEDSVPSQANTDSCLSGQLRPRVFLSDEQQWRLITGHGPDLKRIPKFEWLALVDIASTRTEGILQGNLVRITGQDKRSLPMRTDALAAKGYIIKQSILVRGCRSSKLWLSRFAESAAEDAKREGLPLEQLDLSRETLTSNLDPLPFCDLWTSRPVDYLAIAQAFIAVSKAWDMIRYCDLRTKLGLEQKAPLMRALAKTSRLFTDLGVIRFIGGRFGHSSRIYKDCVKFVREPTEQEWKEFRAVPRNRIQAPSQRLGKRGEAYRASLTAGKNQTPKQKKTSSAQDDTQEVGNQKRHSRHQYVDYEMMSKLELGPLSRVLQKPFPNTVYDIIKRAGDNGSSNTELSQLTLGHGYKKMIAAVSRSISAPPRTASSEPYRVISHKHRVGKIDAYRFFSTGLDVEDMPAYNHAVDDSPDSGKHRNHADHINPTGVVVPLTAYDFTDQPASAFRKRGLQSLTQLAQVSDGRPKSGKRRYKRKMSNLTAHDAEIAVVDDKEAIEVSLVEDAAGRTSSIDGFMIADPVDDKAMTDDALGSTASHNVVETHQGIKKDKSVATLPQTVVPEKRRRGRPPKTPQLAAAIGDEPLEEDSVLRKARTQPTHKNNGTEDLASVQVTDAPVIPGVHRAPNNALDPPGRKGRPKKSYVVVIRSPKLRKASFLGDVNRNAPRNYVVVEDGQGSDICSTQVESQVQLVDTPIGDAPVAIADALPMPRADSVAVTEPAEEDPEARLKRWKCDLCGKRWKNDNGLEYHQKKAKVSCNPNYIPILKEVSPPPPPSPTRPPPTQVLIQRELSAAKKFKAEPRTKSKRAQPALPEATKASPRSMPRTRFPHKPSRGRLASQIGSILTSQCKMLDTENAKNNFLQYAQRSSMIITDISTHHAAGAIDTGIQMGLDISPVRQRSHRIPNELPNTAETTSDSAFSTRTDGAKLYPENEGRDLPQAIDAPPSRFGSRIEQLWDDVMLAQDAGGIDGNSKNKLSQLRNERVRRVVEFLLENNNGVFPGDQSLLSVISHLWARRYYDMAPPDERTLRRIVNKMERDGQLAQSFFSFFDEKSQSHNISVLIDPTSIVSLADASGDPRVLEIKEGVKKYFPNPFSPPGFEFTARAHQAERTRDDSSTYEPCADSVNGDTLEEVEVLPYALPVMTDVTLLGEETPIKAKKRTLVAEKRPTAAKRTRLSSSIDPGIQAFIDSQQPLGAVQLEQVVLQAHNAPIAHVSESLSNDLLHIDPLLEQSILGSGPLASEVNPESQTPKTRKKPGPKLGSKRKTKNTPQKAKASQGSIKPIQATEALGIPQNHEPLVAQSRLPGRTVDYLAASRSEQDAAREWIQDQSIPAHLKASLELSNQTVELADLDDNDLGDFERSVDIVQHWEQAICSPSTRLGQDQTIPGSIFINHGLAILPQFLAAVRAQWLPQNQLGVELLPHPTRVHNGAGHQAKHVPETPQRPSSGPAIKRLQKATPESTPVIRGPRSTRKVVKQKAKVLPKRVEKQIDYKIRSLTTLPAAHQGRIHKRRLSTDRMGLRGETDIISAFVIFKVLGGGVEQTSDYGMVLKLFPEQSLSGLKRFWGRVSKERKVHIAALSKVFPKAFLAAYRKGELAPLDYDHFEEYDWLALVKWTSKLRLYEDIELPADRDDFDDLYELEEPVDQVPDWREMFFSVTSLFGRIDASAGKAASTIDIGSQIFDTELLLRARSWIRSLTRTQIRGPGTGDSVRAKLLELCEGDEESTNQLLEVVVNQLTDEKFATRTKGKRANQSLRLNANFSKHFERNCHVEKFAQAIAFKGKMDAAFRQGKELKLSYGADDGASLAMLNLQAYRRIHVNQIGFRHVPMGHEPGNYEGRKFPKSYYHFTITLTPTDTYMYNTEMQGLEQALLAEVPTHGPRGEIPAWVNLFGQADYVRWIEYLCTFVFAAATRGPVTAQSMCLIFKPTFELFEAQLILDFVDRLGLLKRLTATSEGVTVGEWWWLVIGSLLDVQQKGRAVAAGPVLGA